MSDTKHNHPGPYGFVACPEGCPRGAELAAGAAPRRPAWTDQLGRRARDEAATSRAIDAHFAPGGPHARGDCGPVCTAFDW